MIKRITLALLLATSLIQTSELPQEEIEASDIYKVQSLTVKFLYRDECGEVQEIQRAFVGANIRDLSPKDLHAVLPHLVINIKQSDDGQYHLRAHVKGLVKS